MSGLVRTRSRARRLVRPGAAGLVVLGLMLAAGEGRAQQQIVQDGRLFDANPALNAGPYNYARPASPLLGGNPYATGNVGRGMSLRSSSPIGAATAFRGDLGSTALSDFIRDSISTGSAYSPGGGLSATAFYDPARTAPTASYLSGYASFQPITPGGNPSGQVAGGDAAGWQAVGLPQYGAPPAQLQVYDTSKGVSSQYLGQPLNTQLSSGIFGPQSPRLPGMLSQAELQPNATYVPGVEDPRGVDGATKSDGDVPDPLDLRIWPEPPTMAANPLDTLLRENAARLAGEGAFSPRQPGDVFSATGVGAQPDAAGWAESPAALPDTIVQPGGDVFTDMRLALDLSDNPQAEWYTEIFAPPGGEATAAPSDSATASIERQARALDAAEQFLTRVFEAPLQTFAGDSATAVNDELRAAEAAMKLGHYYDAVQHYERVRVLDPANPLPLIGKGHAMLAAGEYVSAAVILIQGLDRFPELARFHVDLTALMGGGEIVDIRRADLMKQLDRREDTQLRFLLGYLELHSGLVEYGMENLQRAARDADPGSLIRRYPDLVRHKAWLSPGLPGGESDKPAPAGNDAPPTEPAAAEEDSK